MTLILKKEKSTGHNEHAASMRGLSVRKVVVANKMKTKINPVTDKITIEISRETEESKLFIVNVEGQVQLEQKITQSKTQIDISTLPNGVYFMRLTGERTVQMGKLVKQ